MSGTYLQLLQPVLTLGLLVLARFGLESAEGGPCCSGGWGTMATTALSNLAGDAGGAGRCHTKATRRAGLGWRRPGGEVARRRRRGCKLRACRGVGTGRGRVLGRASVGGSNRSRACPRRLSRPSWGDSGPRQACSGRGARCWEGGRLCSICVLCVAGAAGGSKSSDVRAGGEVQGLSTSHAAAQIRKKRRHPPYNNLDAAVSASLPGRSPRGWRKLQRGREGEEAVTGNFSSKEEAVSLGHLTLWVRKGWEAISIRCRGRRRRQAGRYVRLAGGREGRLGCTDGRVASSPLLSTPRCTAERSHQAVLRPRQGVWIGRGGELPRRGIIGISGMCRPLRPLRPLALIDH